MPRSPELVEAITDNKTTIATSQPAGGSWNATTRRFAASHGHRQTQPRERDGQDARLLQDSLGLDRGRRAGSGYEVVDPRPDTLHAKDDLSVKIDGIEKLPGAKFAISLTVNRDLAMPEPYEVIFQEYEAELWDAQNHPSVPLAKPGPASTSAACS